ncbi:MAG: amidohydrolase [Erysipelotrichaceae bacterium]|nr:amidohydrolase [Erysipelotrichaceae bacterium]
MDKIIDVHTHFITKDYLDFLTRHDALNEDGFPIPKWHIEEHLDLMNKNHIEYSLLSLSSPHPYYGNIEESKQLCRNINEYCASLKHQYPDKIGFCAILPLPNINGAIEEAIYALDVLNANGIKLASNSAGQYLGDVDLKPLYEILNDRHSIVVIHPNRPVPIAENTFSAKPAPLYEFMVDTTRTVLDLIASNIPIDYPNIKFIVPHCGSFLPNIADRFIGIQPLLDMHIDVKGNISKLYFDIAGNPVPHLLKLLLTITSPEKIIYGSDFPFTPRMTVEKNLETLVRYLNTDDKLHQYKDMILYENAENILKETL